MYLISNFVNKTQTINKVLTTRFRNNPHQARSYSKDWKAKQFWEQANQSTHTGKPKADMITYPQDGLIIVLINYII